MAEAGNNEFCIHVFLKVALFLYYLCRQSLTYFSAPAGENFSLRDLAQIGLFLKQKYEIFRDI